MEWLGCAQGEDTIHDSSYYPHLQSWHWWGAEKVPRAFADMQAMRITNGNR